MSTQSHTIEELRSLLAKAESSVKFAEAMFMKATTERETRICEDLLFNASDEVQALEYRLNMAIKSEAA